MRSSTFLTVAVRPTSKHATMTWCECIIQIRLPAALSLPRHDTQDSKLLVTLTRFFAANGVHQLLVEVALQDLNTHRNSTGGGGTLIGPMHSVGHGLASTTSGVGSSMPEEVRDRESIMLGMR